MKQRRGTGKKIEQKWGRSLPRVRAAWLLMLLVAHGGVVAVVVVLLLVTEGDILFFSSFPLFFVLLSRFLFFPFLLPLCFPFSFVSPSLSFLPFSHCFPLFPFALSFFSYVSLFLSVLLRSPLYNLPRLFFVPCSSLYLCIYKGERGKESYYPCLVMARG
jgi:hypothetical protein